MAGKLMQPTLTERALPLRSQIEALHQRIDALEEKMKAFEEYAGDCTFRLARRLARVEAATPAIQCEDGF